jgi:hypothetical protein
METKERPHTVKQQAFIAEYTDPNSDSFGNGTQAYKKAYLTNNDNTAGSNANKLLKNAKIRHHIDKILDSIGYGEKVRLQMLTEIGMGKYIKRTEQTRLDAKGNVKDTIITESTPGADSIVRVNDVINRLTGKYEAAKQGARVMSKSFQAMVDKITSQATTPKPAKKVKQTTDQDNTIDE